MNNYDEDIYNANVTDTLNSAALHIMNNPRGDTNYYESNIGLYSSEINQNDTIQAYNKGSPPLVSSSSSGFQDGNVLLLNNQNKIDQYYKDHDRNRALFHGSSSSSSSSALDADASSCISFYNVMDEYNFDSSATLNVELMPMLQQHQANANSRSNLRKATLESNGDDDDDNNNHNDEGEQIIMEYKNEDQEIRFQPIRNNVQIHCYLPPKSNMNTTYARTNTNTNATQNSKQNFSSWNSIINQQRLYGLFRGNIGFVQPQRGFSNTTMQVGYYLCNGNSLLVDWITENGLSKMSYGISSSSLSSKKKNKRNIYSEVKVHYPSSSFMYQEEHDHKYNKEQNSKIYGNSSNRNMRFRRYQQPSLSLYSAMDIIPKKVRGYINLQTQQQYLSSSVYEVLRRTNTTTSIASLPLCTFGWYTTLHYQEGNRNKDDLKNILILPRLEWKMSKNTQQCIYHPYSITLKYVKPHLSTPSSSSSQTELSITTHGNSYSFFHHTQYTLHALFTRYITSSSTSSVSMCNTNNSTRVSTGIELDSFRGLSWLFQWRKGDFCMNVPIRLSHILFGGSGSCSVGDLGVVWKVISTSYITFLSLLIDSIISDVIQKSVHHIITNNATTNYATSSSTTANMERTLTLRKMKKDAEQQKELMKRKSNINKRNEDEKDGLVIVNAKYGLLSQIASIEDESGERSNGENNGVLDVSIQLQFWVNDSKLVLTSNSKSQMLGFYDVRLCSNSSSTSYIEKQQQSDHLFSKDVDQTRGFGLVSLWKNLFSADSRRVSSDYKKSDSATAATIPCLMIRYKFDGLLYDMKVMDDEAITLPSPRAVKVID